MNEATPQPAPSPTRILVVFLLVALTTFGSSQSAAIQRQVVRVQGWLSLEEFMILRGLAMVVPGPNSPSLALLVGQRLAGSWGALFAYLAASVPGLVVVLVLGALALDPHNHIVGSALRGAAAATVGLVGANAVELTAVFRRRWLPLAIALATLLVVLVAHWSLWLTLALFLPVSIALMRTRASGAPYPSP